MAGLDDGTLRQGLARLVEAELVFVRGIPPEATYTFKHALMQELVIRDHDRRHGRDSMEIEGDITSRRAVGRRFAPGGGIS